MRTVHRFITLFAAILLLYLAVTGLLIQSIDLYTLHIHAPASDPNMRAIRESYGGPEDFVVIATADYALPPLPAVLDLRRGLAELMDAARSRLGEAPLDYAEIRMTNAGPAGVVASGSERLRLDLSSGTTIVDALPAPEPSVVPSARYTAKRLHNMAYFSNRLTWINPVLSLALSALLLTGVWMYLQLLRARRRARRRGWFWSAGGWWRTLHRWVALCAVLFVLVITLSGAWLAFDVLWVSSHGQLHAADQAGPARPSASSPLRDAQLPEMLQTTLSAYAAQSGQNPIKSVRLRIYGGMPQGIVIGGMNDQTSQSVFNASTGASAGFDEPGYPQSPFLFGLQSHLIAKKIHRGDFIGLPGRWMDLFGGLSIVFLSISGTVMYLDMWLRRRRNGRTALVWK